MIKDMAAFQLQPLADLGLLLRFETESACQSAFRSILASKSEAILDLVCAYKALAIYHNPAKIQLNQLETSITEWLSKQPLDLNSETGKLHKVPCCYELGEDLVEVARLTGLGKKEVVELHSACVYTVHAIGFSPGFPYLGYLPEKLQGVARLDSPRLKVPAGSVGLTGIQTGIYPQEKPGGWRLIGRTPLLLVDVEENYFPLKVGDVVKFEPITIKKFDSLKGSRLP